MSETPQTEQRKPDKEKQKEARSALERYLARLRKVCGGIETIEEWTFAGCWPHAVNFGSMCYSNSEEVDLEVTWRYKTVEYESKILGGQDEKSLD